MIVTETTAKTLECPMARNNSNKNDRKCLGSACLAWTWQKRADSHNGPTALGHCGMVRMP